MLRLVNLEDGYELAHGRNVRSTKHKTGHYAVSDLKFHPRDDLVASCSSNASVVLWHLARMGGGANDGGKMAEHKTKEHGGHKRAVHSLSWQPSKDKVLLTCSADGTMKLWDLRMQQCVHTTFSGHHAKRKQTQTDAVAIRSVQFHPGGYPDVFLAGLENGQVQIWDTRKIQEHVCALGGGCDCGSSKRPKPWAGWKYDSDFTLQNDKNKFIKVQAHDQHVYSVQWHPSEKDWFASSGRDGMVHCWDLSKDNRNPVKSIKNMDFKSAVSRVAWRPGYESCLATCGGGLNDYKIHVWDADRAFLPLCFFKAGLPPERAKASASKAIAVDREPPAAAKHQQDHDTAGHTDDVTGLLWLDGDHLASCSKDGTVRIHEVREGYRPYQGISTVTPAWSSLGEVAVAGAPIVRDWVPKRDQAWLDKAERRRARRVERQGTGGGSRRSRSESALSPSGSGMENVSDSTDRDSRGSASGRWRRGVLNAIGATKSSRDVTAAAGRSSNFSREGGDLLDSGHKASVTEDVDKNQEVSPPGHGLAAGAPSLNPSSTTVQWQRLSEFGGFGGSETDAAAASVSAVPAGETIPEGGWVEQPYHLGYNTDLFEYLAKNYSMTPIFSTLSSSQIATSTPNRLNAQGDAGAVGSSTTASTGETDGNGNPQSASGTPYSSPRSTPRAAAGVAAALAASALEKTTAESPPARGVVVASGSGSTPPSSPTRLSASNVDSTRGTSTGTSNNADMISRREITLALARLDRNAARSLGVSTPVAAAAIAKGTVGPRASEDEQRAKHCLHQGDVAVRDEDELDKAVRWYIAGIAALKGVKASGAGAGRTHASASSFRLVHTSTATKVSTTENLLAAQLDRRLSWARRRHCDGVAAAVRHNATVALRAGQRELANCWQMLQALVTRNDNHDDEESQYTAENDANGGLRRHDAVTKSSVGSDTCAAAAAMAHTGLLDGLFGTSVQRLATWFAERRGEADLQSAVTLLLLVGRPYMWSASDAIPDMWPPHDPSEFSHGAEKAVGPAPPQPGQVWRQSNRTQAEQQGKAQQSPALTWCHAYVELLQRHKLDTLAIRVSHLSQCGAIQKLNQERVHFKAVAKCLSCHADLPPAPESAAKEAGSHCNNPACVMSQSARPFGTQTPTDDGGLGYVNARCGVCRLPVRGPWVWCQGCGHGGHLACYENWFGHQRLCPTGCNHLCNLVSDGLDDGLTQD